MKGIVITPEGEVSVRDFPEPLYKTVGAVVGGLIQVVNPKGLPEPFCMVVNEEGRLKKLPFHPIASFWYGTQRHKQPIVGTVVLLKETLNADRELDLAGLEDTEISFLQRHITEAKASKLPEEPEDAPIGITVLSFNDGESFADAMHKLFGAGGW